VTADDLSAPLGQRKLDKPRFSVPAVVPRAIAASLGLVLAIFGFWILFVDDPFGGEPAVVVTGDARPGAQAKLDAHSAPKVEPSPTTPSPSITDLIDKTPIPGTRTVTIIDGLSGKRQEVPVAPTNAARGAAIDPRMVETSRHGPIPRIAADGSRPSEMYAQPMPLSGDKSAGLRVAIVVDGLGLSASGTSEALAKLPAKVTLGFMPYGTDLERWVGRARNEGHEVLLQVPMEPFDYPDNDPGPQTLLTSLNSDQNIDRLHWFMSRIQGYVGMTNYMGARFSATEPAFTPVLRDVAKRGLIYFDDAASPRSLAGQIAGASNAAFAKADIVIDAVASASEIDAALARLEKMARERGVAVGVATSLPVTIERIFQ